MLKFLGPPTFFLLKVVVLFFWNVVFFWNVLLFFWNVVVFFVVVCFWMLTLF